MHLPTKTLFCVPTQEERDGILSFLPQDVDRPIIHISGLGMMISSYEVSNIIRAYDPNMIIHLGIAGALNAKLKIGQLVEVRTESIVDMGAEKKDKSMLSMHHLVSSYDGNVLPWNQQILRNPYKKLAPEIQSVSGLTVPFTSGSLDTIERRQNKGKDIENMEGAAFFYTCLRMKTTFHSIRAISNFVQPRDRMSWDLDSAFNSLAQFIVSTFGKGPELS